MGRRRLTRAGIIASLLVVGACESDDGGGAAVEPTIKAEVGPTTSRLTLPHEVDAADIARVVEGILGPSTDPNRDSAALVDLPTDIPVPRSVVVTELHVTTTAQPLMTPASPGRAETETVITLWTPAATADVVTLYRTVLPGNGFVQIGVSEPEQVDRTQMLDFESVDDANPTKLSMVVFDIEAAVADGRIESPTTGTQVRLTFTTEHDGPVDRFDWWPDELPVPTGATTRTAINTGWYEPRGVVALSTTVRVHGAPDAVASDIRRMIDEPGRSDAPMGEQDVTFTGEHPGLGTVVYTVSPASGDRASSDVTVEACLGIEPAGDDLRVTSQYLHWSSCEQSIGAAPPEAADATPTVPTTSVAERRALTGRSATGEELRDAAVSILGPTNDVVAELAPIVGLPAVLATPSGTDIVWFSTTIDLTTDGWSSADVELVVDGTVDDVTTFFETTLTAAGYLRSIGERTGTGADVRDDLQFTLEDGGFDDVAEITVTVGRDALIHADGARSGTPVAIAVSRPVVDQGELAADAWGLPLPGLAAGMAVEWTLALNLVGVPALDLATTYALDGDAAGAIEAIRAQPPPGAELADTGGQQPEDVWLERAGYESFWATPAEGMGADRSGIRVIGSLPLSGGPAD